MDDDRHDAATEGPPGPGPAAPQATGPAAQPGMPGGQGSSQAAPDPTVGPAQADEVPPPGMADYRATAGLMLAFVVTMLLAVAFARPFIQADIQAFEDPENVGNSVAYLGLILAFTALILYIAKRGKKWLIKAIILLAVGATVMYVVAPLLMTFPAISTMAAWAIGASVGGGSVLWLYKHPEWYVVDLVGILVAAGAASIFGISLNVVPVVVLLVALAIYDAIAVYKTKHMLSLADSVIELRLPVLLVVPKHAGYSFLAEAAKFNEASSENREDREAFFMGLGDLVMPTILVVSALTFGHGIQPVLGAAVGTLVGFGVLMGYVLRGNPQAGLPLLNGGAIVGFLAGTYAATGSIAFW